MSIEEKLKELQALAEQIAPIQEAKSCKESDDEDEDDVSNDGKDSEIENDSAKMKKGMTEKMKPMKESELEEAAPMKKTSVGANALHVQHVGGGKYKVHAVGKNFAHGISPGEHLSDTELDDFSEMGGKIKHVEPKNESEVKEETKAVEESKIDLGNLFQGEELSEEFKAKAAAVFESAVALRVKQELAELQEGFEKQIVNESVELKESLVDKVDGYLDYMVEQWMEKNELAINRGIKTEILESFVSGMKSLFESHYIDVPDEKYDLVEAKQEEVQTLEQRLDEQTGVIINLQKQIKEINRQIQIDEACKGMADTDAERFRQLAEELVFTDSDEFKGKLSAIVESYFTAAPNGSTKKKVLAEEFMTDAPVEVLEESNSSVDPLMAKYLKAIEKSGF